ncbi:hypothetical protein GCT13_14420 [Paraburkholderia sp. CNPSo 3157]|uniref:RNA chaperone Hfq n=2 Tax=Paraburkholderia franconis TaxID=2654983 RepID=A0A7X1TGA9_9BURK|nr:hypothetical protein [Paraburkholderia franconis]
MLGRAVIVKDKTTVNVFLVNGIKLSGQLAAFDQFVVLLQAGSAVQLVQDAKPPPAWLIAARRQSPSIRLAGTIKGPITLPSEQHARRTRRLWDATSQTARARV